MYSQMIQNYRSNTNKFYTQSKFTSFNKIDEELDIEQHTREIQIESALSTLNDALESQRRGDWQVTMEFYHKLGSHDIMVTPNTVHNPIIDQLKYLLHRNRGLLEIRRLIGSTETPMEIYQSLIKALVDLIRSTLYQEPDLKLIEILSSLFTHLGLSKLARLILEFKVGNIIDPNNQDTELVWDLSNPLEILPDQINLMNDYIKFIDSLGQSSSQLYTHIKNNVNSQIFWDAVTDEHETNDKLKSIISMDQFNSFRVKDKFSDLDIDVSVVKSDANIDELFHNLLEAMPKHKGRRKFFDGYILTEKPVDSVKFDFNISDENKRLVIADTLVMESNEEDDENADNNENAAVDDILPIEGSVTSPTDEILRAEELSTFTPLPVDEEEISAVELSARKYDKNVGQPEVINNTSDDSMKTNGQALQTDQTFTKQHLPKSPDDINIQRVRNTRNKPDVIKQPLISEMFIQHDTFLTETLHDFMKKANLDINLKQWSQIILDVDHEEPIYSILIESLLDWKPINTESLTTSVNIQVNKRDADHNSGEELVKEILTYNGSDKTTQRCTSFAELDQGGLYTLLQELNNSNLHLFQIRIELLSHLFTLNQSNYGTLLTNGVLKRRTVNNIKSVLDSVEINLLKSFSNYVDSGINDHSAVRRINTAVSICELLIDSYLECKQSQRGKANNKNKSRVTELEQIEQSLYFRINKWISLLEETFDECTHFNYDGRKIINNLHGRFNWSKILYLQSSNEDINIPYLLNELKSVISTTNNDELDVQMINFENILPINKHQINIQLSKLKIMDQFSKKGNTNDMLERIFIGVANAEIDKEQLKLEDEVKNIVNASSFDLKFKLWSSLLKQFISERNFAKTQISFELVIELIKDVLSTENLTPLKEDEKTFTLFRCLGYFGNFCELMVQNIFENGHKLCKTDQIKFQSTLKTLTSFFHLLYGYLVYQDSTVLTNGRKNLASNSFKSFNTLNNTVVNVCIIISLYFENSLLVKTNEDINDFLSILHGELGLRNICSFSNGRYLSFMQHRLVELDWVGSSNDIFQILNCRFGFHITGDDFEPYDHKCKAKKMEENDALDLSQFIVSYCHKKKHPIISPPRSDVKTMLDSIIDLIGSHDQKDSIIEKNGITVKKYLNETDIDLAFIIKVFNGGVTLPMEVSQNVKFSVVKNGVYYLQAAIALHSYKVRRRNMQSRVAELDYVIKMLLTDLVSGVERLESWLLLGQSFGYLVEDDLIWTADKLNSLEKRKYTAFIQKKSLICYFMAINIYLKMNNTQKLDVQPIINTLWSSFAIELYNSWFFPLNKLAFHVIPTESSKEIISNGFEMTLSELSMDTQVNDIPQRVIIKILEIAFGKESTNWFNLMYQGKSKSKLDGQNINYSEIVELLLKSCKLAIDSSNKDDPIIEPHYQMLSTVLKMVELGNCDVTGFISYLKLNPLFTSIFDQLEGESNVYKLSEHLLKKIENYDKKKWQHRPIFKLAKIYGNKFNDYKMAQEQMAKIINLKPTVRNLTTIWKPDHERPGRHFYYCAEYSTFISDLLFKMNDVHSLSMVVKKLRKLASTITTPLKIYDTAMSKLCILVKEITRMPVGLLDLAIQKLKLSEFTETSKELLNQMKEQKIEDISNEQQLLLFFLSETQAFKKLTNGFAATSSIDEVFHSLYMMIYYPYVFDRLVSKTKFDLIPIIEGKLYLNDPSQNSSISEREYLNANLSIDNDAEGNDSDISMTTGNEYTPNEIENANNVKVLEFAKDLTLEDKIKIIWYVTPIKMSNLNKEKSRIAKRDISPIAQELITEMSQTMEELKDKFNDPENLRFDLPILSDEQIEKLTSAVAFRQTKDFKEENDLQKYAESHDISLKNEDLESLNLIFKSFGVGLLNNNPTKTEENNVRDEKLKKKQEMKKAVVEAKKQEIVAMELERQAESAKAFILTQQREIELNSHTSSELPSSIQSIPSTSVPTLVVEGTLTEVNSEEEIKMKLVEPKNSKQSFGIINDVDLKSETSIPVITMENRNHIPQEVEDDVLTENIEVEITRDDKNVTEDSNTEINISINEDARERISLTPTFQDETIQQSLNQFVKVKKVRKTKKRPVTVETANAPTINDSSKRRRFRGRGSSDAPLTMLGDRGKPINLAFTSKEEKSVKEVELIESSPTPEDNTVIEIE